MKKLIFLMCIILFVVGCSKKEDVMILECDMIATTITLTVDNAKIVKYVDEIKGELSSDEIDLLNESYLKDITNNKDAIVKLREVIARNGGDCK